MTTIIETIDTPNGPFTLYRRGESPFITVRTVRRSCDGYFIRSTKMKDLSAAREYAKKIISDYHDNFETYDSSLFVETNSLPKMPFDNTKRENDFKAFLKENHIRLRIDRRNVKQEIDDAIKGNWSVSRITRIFRKLWDFRCCNPDCLWDHSKAPVSPQLDHINGNGFNNGPANLRWLCPNCHSLTDTYKSRNKGNGRHSRIIKAKKLL